MIKRIIKFLVVIVLIGTFIWTFYFLYKKSDKPPVVFNTATPVIADIVKKTVATGSILPRKEVLVKSQVSGIIEKIYVEAGKTIKQGDVIAKIKIIPNMVNLNNAETRVNQAKIALDNASQDFERTKKLYEQQVASRVEYQQTELRYNTAKEELNSAENNLQLIKEGVVKNSDQGTNTLVRSTISGMLLDVPVKEGNSVIESNTFNEGTTIATVADMGEMIFEGKVDESEVGKLQTGMDLVLTIGAIEEEKFNAKLEYIAPKGVLDNGAIQFQIKAAMKLKAGKFLRAGYSANADIILAKKEKVLAVSESLLQFENDKIYVEVEESPNKFVKREIKTGLSDGINIELVDGLKQEEKIKVPDGVPAQGHSM